LRNTMFKAIQIGRRLSVKHDFASWVSAFQSGDNRDLDFHVTLAYSKAAVDWNSKIFEPAKSPIIVNGGERSLERFDQGALVLCFECEEFVKRWQALCGAGASWDYKNFKPHITVKYDASASDTKISPYTGSLVFEGEYRKKVRLK